MDVSVVIPSYNSEDTIEPCLASLRRQQTDRSFEVIVVDSSNDCTPNRVREFSEVKLIKLSNRIIPAVARNIGVAQSQGNIICFTDSECDVENDWIEKLSAAIEKRQWAAVGGSVLNAYGHSNISWADYIAEFGEYTPHGPERECERCLSCNMAVSKNTFLKYGGFNEHIAQYSDTEFSSRLRAKNERLLFMPDIKVSYRLRTSPLAYIRYELIRGRTDMMIRRSGSLPGNKLTRFRASAGIMAIGILFKYLWDNTKRTCAFNLMPVHRLPWVLPWFVAGGYSRALGSLLEGLFPTTAATQNNSQERTTISSEQL